MIHTACGNSSSNHGQNKSDKVADFVKYFQSRSQILRSANKIFNTFIYLQEIIFFAKKWLGKKEEEC